MLAPSRKRTRPCTIDVGCTNDLDPVVVDAEEVVRFDHLETFVGERGGVDRDLRSHVPGRVGQRLLGGHVDELVAGASAERPPLAC